MTRTNHQFLLKSRPQGLVTAENFDYVEQPAPVPGDGEVLVANQYLSLDPAMRGWVNEGKSYVPPVGIGEVMRALGVGQVIESNNHGFKRGDYVTGMLGVQDYAVGQPKQLNLFKVDPKVVPLPRYLGALGMPGMTAYFGILQEGRPKEGETVVVSGAAGAVGSMVGQIAKLHGCRVVGIAGGPAKCDHVVEEYGFDACIDYKQGGVRDALKKHCPDGVDIYFDNVGGDILDTVLAHLALRARVIICGAISQYNNESGKPQGPSNYLSLLVNRATMKGIVVLDYQKNYAQAGLQIAQWMSQGKLKVEEHIVEGLEAFPEALGLLFTGGNRGKLVLKLFD